MTLPDAPPSRTAVDLRVRAEFDQLPVLRAVAEVIAVLADFNLDHVSDIKLAVDEVCSSLVKDAAADAEVVCRFESTADSLHVRIETDTIGDRMPDERGFGWHVLRAVTDSLAAEHEPRPGSGFRTTVEFTKVRDGT
jgi:serine/threonine-protein kinase RsbW